MQGSPSISIDLAISPAQFEWTDCARRSTLEHDARFKLLIKGLPEQPSIDRVVSLTPWGNAGFTLRMPKQSAYPVASCFITAYAVELIEEGKREPLPRLSENVTASL